MLTKCRCQSPLTDSLSSLFCGRVNGSSLVLLGASPPAQVFACRQLELLISELDFPIESITRILRQLSELQKNPNCEVRLSAESAFDRLVAELQLRTVPAVSGFHS